MHGALGVDPLDEVSLAPVPRMTGARLNAQCSRRVRKLSAMLKPLCREKQSRIVLLSRDVQVSRRR